MHKGVVGAGNLNVELQKALNPGEGGVMRGNRNYRVNDKVMQIKNNYDKEVYYVLLQWNLIYTAVTRGRKLVVIVGTKKALAIGVKNDKTQKRYTYLRYRLNF